LIRHCKYSSILHRF